MINYLKDNIVIYIFLHEFMGKINISTQTAAGEMSYGI